MIVTKEGVKSPVAFIAGPVTGGENYHVNFEAAEERLCGKGYIVMNPAVLPVGLQKLYWSFIGGMLYDNIMVFNYFGVRWACPDGAL